MKNSFTLLCVAFFLICSCKKSTETQIIKPGNGEKYSVTFNADGFKETVDEFKSSKTNASILDDTLNKYVPKLYCRIFNLGTTTGLTADGPLVYLKDQTPDSVGFGKITASLTPSNYVAVFVGSGQPFNRLAGLGTGASLEFQRSFKNSHFNTLTSIAAINLPIQDIFYKKVYFTVSNQGITQPVVLDRLVSKLEIQIEDAIPTMTRIEVVVTNESSMYTFWNDARDIGGVKTINSTLSSTNNTFSTLLLKQGPAEVTLKVYNAANNFIPIKEKKINFTLFTNKKTVLKGKLFTETTDFNVSVNPAWDTPPPVVTF